MQPTVKKALIGLVGVDIAVGIAFVLVVNLVDNGSNEEKDVQRAVFFAMHTDKDADNIVRLLADEYENEEECSLAKNVDDTKAAIMEIKNQQFRFIFFTENASASESMELSEALNKLDEVKNETDLQTKFKQLPVLDEFLSKKGSDDSLIYYIPCKFNNSAGDKDMDDFVRKLNSTTDIKQSILVVSAIEDGDTIKEWYSLDKGSVVGKNEDVAARIREFVVKERTTAKPSPTEASVTTLKTTEVSITTTGSVKTTTEQNITDVLD